MEAGYNATEMRQAGFGTRATWDVFLQSEADGFNAYEAGFAFQELLEHGIINDPADASAWGFPATPDVLRAIHNEPPLNPLEA